MSKAQNVRLRVAVLPSAPPRYEQSQESQFRLVLEQEIQQLQVQVAELAELVDGILNP